MRFVSKFAEKIFLYYNLSNKNLLSITKESEYSRMKKRTKILIGVLSILMIAGATSSIGFWVYHSYQEQQEISSMDASIQEQYRSFQKEDDRLEKLNLYESLKAEAKDYKDSDSALDDVTTTYQKTLKKMKHFFTDDYDSCIQSNTLSKKELASDKDAVTKSIKAFSDELAVIHIEKDTVLTNDEFNEYKEKLNRLITTYTDQLAVLDKEDTLASYDEKIKNNTIDAASTEDANLLSKAKEALSDCLDDIEDDNICNDDELVSYEEQIHGLISGYDARLQELEVASAADSHSETDSGQSAAKKPDSSPDAPDASSENEKTPHSVSTYDVTTWHLKCNYNGTCYMAPDNVSSLYFDQGHTIDIRIVETDENVNIQWYDTVTGILYDSQGNQI